MAADRVSAAPTDPVDPFAMPQHPGIGDIGNLGACISIRLPQPGKDEVVTAWDHDRDDSTVPSDARPCHHAPDLWVRRENDGGGEHQDPAFNHQNYISAKVHNIGCADPGAIWVTYYWANSSECSEPTGAARDRESENRAPAKSLGSAYPTFAVAKRSPAPAWSGLVLSHRGADVPGDPANADARADRDKNKVERIITFVQLAPTQTDPP